MGSVMGACTNPRRCYFHADGGRPWFGAHPDPGSPLWTVGQVDCRTECLACLEKYARMNAVRCGHEAQMHERNCFLTLTYDQRHLPPRNMVSKAELGRFVKRLREWWRRDYSVTHAVDGFKFFGVGEYGETTRRAHYHVLAFGADFDDRKYRQKSHGGYSVFESGTLSALWPFGLATVGEANMETAMYCARYSLKKLDASGERVDRSRWVRKADRNWRTDPVTGERYRWQPEFCAKSKGLGESWLLRYDSDVFSAGGDQVIIHGGARVGVPDFYTRRLREWCEEDYQALKARHREAMESNLGEYLPDRLAVQAQVRAARLRYAKREGV